MPGDNKTTPAQAKALNELRGLVGENHVGGRTLCCLIGGQGSGKTWLAETRSVAWRFWASPICERE